MASVNSVSSSNANSLYGNRNVISGLASGMDTESMIQNAVSGIRTKISGLLQKQTKLSWKQEAYWNVTDKLVQFSRKYSSYTSSTNLLSGAFFNKAVTTTTSGANASKVSATGKTGSNIVINSVDGLATTSRYQLEDVGVLKDAKRYIQAGSELNLDATTPVSNLSGTLTLGYGGSTKVSVTFKSDEVYNSLEDFAAAINEKLADQKITMSSNSGSSSTISANEAIKAVVKDGKIAFEELGGRNNGISVAGASGELKKTMGLEDANFSGEDKITELDPGSNPLSKNVSVREQVADKTMSFTLDGVTKRITLPGKDEIASMTESEFATAIDKSLASAFGANKVKAELTDGKLTFTPQQQSSSLSINSEASKAMGMKSIETSYLNTGKTLGELLGTGLTDAMALKGEGVAADWIPVEGKDGFFTDTAGNLVKDGYRVDKDGNKQYGLTINGKQIGAYTKDTAMETVMLDINNDATAGVSLNYSKLTNQFVFTAKETGAGHDISVGTTGGNKSTDLGKALFGEGNETVTDGSGNVKELTKMTQGTDATINMTVNGTSMTVNRSSNTFDVDGLSITVSGTFTADSGQVSFVTKADTDKIVDTIAEFVKDYNDMVKTLRDSFSTTPLTKSDKSKYEPLTDDDMEGMSDSAIESYNEKAKTGVLFADSDLSSLYSKLTSAISPAGADGAALRNMGISTVYSEGLTTIELNEDKMRSMLDSNPDAVRDAFSKVAGSGSATNGLMQTMKTHLDTYAATEGTKGLLINKAGSKYSAASLLQNSLKTQIETYDEQVEKWQTKLSDKVDYYTSQFSRLEQLISQMNSQSSSLQGMMGGG